MIILDGLGDRPLAELDGRTPLEAARTPNLDALTKAALTGLADPIAPGVPVSTETGVGVLMGLSIPHGIPPRGVIEATGAGLSLTPADLAWRCNFASVARSKTGWTLLDRRAGRIHGDDSRELAAALNQGLSNFAGLTVRFRAATGHRLALTLEEPTLSAAISDPDPGSGAINQPIPPCQANDANDAAARHTAELLNALVGNAHEILHRHPVNQRRAEAGLPVANFILPRKPGRLPLPPGKPLRGLCHHLGLKAAVIAGERTVIGLGKLLGMDCIVEPGFSGLAATDLAGKVAATKKALAAGNKLIFLHVKAPDLLAHDQNPLGKKDIIEAIDRNLAPLLDFSRWAVAVTADHSTSCATGRHCGDPVPVLLAAPGGRRDRVATYDENACMNGGLGRITANGLLWSLLDQMGGLRTWRPTDGPFIGPGGQW